MIIDHPLYKVERENPKIIKRFRDNADDLPLQNSTVNVSTLRDKYKNLEKFCINKKINPLKKIRAIYDYVDWMHHANGESKLAVCQKGCAGCCTVDVDVSLLEAIYICEDTGLGAVARNGRIRGGYHLKDSPCPLLDLDTATCTVYERRPLACRTFHAIDNPKYCYAEPDDETGRLPEHMVTSIHGSDLLKHLQAQLVGMSGMYWCDIREIFLDFTTDEHDGYVDHNTVLEYV